MLKITPQKPEYHPSIVPVPCPGAAGTWSPWKRKGIF